MKNAIEGYMTIRLMILMESRIHGDMYVRFGGEYPQSCHRDVVIGGGCLAYGIFIPGSMEIDAIREIAANLGGNLGTTINLNQQSAGDQLLTDLGKGAIQGTSQYIAKKMRTVKVHLKAGYKLMLYQKKQ